MGVGRGQKLGICYFIVSFKFAFIVNFEFVKENVNVIKIMKILQFILRINNKKYQLM